MSEYGRKVLNTHYDIDPARVSVIAHGIPDVAFVDPDTVKPRMGFAGRAVILTFVLVSPNKGIEVMIDAMPEVLAAINQSGGIDYSRDRAAHYADRAEAALDALPDTEWSRALRGLARYAVARGH